MTRQAYDALAAQYARLLPDLRAEAPPDRAVLSAFVELAGGGAVVEMGCGAGRIAAHLRESGLAVAGVDLSPGMIGQARAAHPELPLAVGDLRALPLREGSLSGVVCWYSLIHLAPDELPHACAGLARVTRPGGPVLVAFQAGGGERVERSTSYGLPVALSYYRHRVEQVADLLREAGCRLQSVVRREPTLPHETAPQAFVLAVRAG